MFGGHGAEVDEDADGVGVDAVEGGAIGVVIVAFFAGFEGERGAVIEGFFVGWVVDGGEGLIGDVAIDGGGERGIGEEIGARGVDGEGS